MVMVNIASVSIGQSWDWVWRDSHLCLNSIMELGQYHFCILQVKLSMELLQYQFCILQIHLHCHHICHHHCHHFWHKVVGGVPAHFSNQFGQSHHLFSSAYSSTPLPASPPSSSPLSSPPSSSQLSSPPSSSPLSSLLAKRSSWWCSCALKQPIYPISASEAQHLFYSGITYITVDYIAIHWLHYIHTVLHLCHWNTTFVIRIL